MSQIQVDLLGFGLTGSVFHASLIQACDGRHLAAIGSRSFEGKQLPAGVRGASIDAVLADPAIELVVVATPNDSHAGLARQALLAGKHLVVDKPFVLSAADAEDLIALARKQERCLSVFHNRRWDADFLTVQQMMAEGRLGAMSYAEFHFDRYRPQLKPRWREQPGEGVGVLYDLGPHLIDQACCLFGLRPDSDAWGQTRGARGELLSPDGEVTVIDTLHGRHQDDCADMDLQAIDGSRSPQGIRVRSPRVQTLRADAPHREPVDFALLTPATLDAPSTPGQHAASSQPLHHGTSPALDMY